MSCSRYGAVITGVFFGEEKYCRATCLVRWLREGVCLRVEVLGVVPLPCSRCYCAFSLHVTVLFRVSACVVFMMEEFVPDIRLHMS